ncbi:MAG: tetratricopeptide repeat protein [Proteobacteria bacterium]|mgnify:CR=1 FL=1|jgi:predicted negative regulator of RcsB-dependent stress response|nr:tetratricopeptide repeat protein [Pseudomonadota bacterium]
MATHLDLEEQEQLDALKHFWKQWGNLITWVLIAVLGAYAAWNGWQYWQRRQANLAAAVYDELGRGAQAGDMARVERALADLKSQYGGTLQAGQGALLGAKMLYQKDKPAEAKAALAWVVEQGKDEGLKAVARLRLASVQTGEKAYDEALKTLSAEFPAPFAALAADRRGDVLWLQGKRAEAAAEFGKAYKGLAADAGEYRRVIGYKLNALGVDPDAAGVTS